MSKRYRLLKNLPNVDKGQVIEWSGLVYQCRDKFGGTASFNKILIENNPEWFMQVQEPKIVLHKVGDKVDSVEVDGELFINAYTKSPEEKAFEAARETIPHPSVTLSNIHKYDTFSDYKKQNP